MKISVIGFGNMGSAIVRSWINTNLCSPADISLFDADSSKLQKYIETQANSPAKTIDISQNKEVLKHSDFVLLAVKPQDLELIRAEYPIAESTIIISILAGMSIAKLGNALRRSTGIVRTMPNLAASVSQSMTGYVVSSDLSLDKIQLTEKLLRAFGCVQQLQSEEMMDAWCAIAGSGPGLVFYLMDKFAAAARELGFSAELSKHLVSQVFLGSAQLAKMHTDSSGENSAEVFDKLVKSVCSKGGTTEKGIMVFEQAGLAEIIKQSLKAAELRSKQLNLL